MGKSVKEGIMPRETVRSADYNFVPVSADSDQDAPITWPEGCRLGILEIGWEKAPRGYVETWTHDESRVFGPDGLVEQIARAVTEGHDVEVVVRDFFQHAGFPITLDRAGCNEAIRRLRKARDDAFGRDE